MSYINQLNQTVTPVVLSQLPTITSDIDVDDLLEQFYAIVTTRLNDSALLSNLLNITNQNKHITFEHIWKESEDRETLITELAETHHIDEPLVIQIVQQATPNVFSAFKNQAVEKGLSIPDFMCSKFSDVRSYLPTWVGSVIPMSVLEGKGFNQSIPETKIDIADEDKSITNNSVDELFNNPFDDSALTSVSEIQTSSENHLINASSTSIKADSSLTATANEDEKLTFDFDFDDTDFFDKERSLDDVTQSISESNAAVNLTANELSNDSIIHTAVENSLDNGLSNANMLSPQIDSDITVQTGRALNDNANQTVAIDSHDALINSIPIADPYAHNPDYQKHLQQQTQASSIEALLDTPQVSNSSQAANTQPLHQPTLQTHSQINQASAQSLHRQNHPQVAHNAQSTEVGINPADYRENSQSLHTSPRRINSKKTVPNKALLFVLPAFAVLLLAAGAWLWFNSSSEKQAHSQAIDITPHNDTLATNPPLNDETINQEIHQGNQSAPNPVGNNNGTMRSQASQPNIPINDHSQMQPYHMNQGQNQVAQVNPEVTYIPPGGQTPQAGLTNQLPNNQLPNIKSSQSNQGVVYEFQQPAKPMDPGLAELDALANTTIISERNTQVHPPSSNQNIAPDKMKNPDGAEMPRMQLEQR